MNLYDQTAPFLSEDPSVQKDPAPKPPHKFWRAKFVGTSLHSFIRFRNVRNWYDNPPPIQIADKVLVCGPICTTAEHAETLARERKTQKDRRFFASHGRPWGWDFVEVIKVGQNGYPL